MSQKPNLRHYHVERDGRVLAAVFQRRRRAWERVAHLSKAAPSSAWRVFACTAPVCRQPKEGELP